MIITFVGHGTLNISRELSAEIKKAIEDNIVDKTHVTFYCGGYGDFDNHCARLCREIKKEIQNCEIIFVTPYITPSQQNKIKYLIDTKLYDDTIYPPLEDVLPRFAITKRNEWMIDKADLIIAFVNHEYGGAYKAIKYAQRKLKRIINLSNSGII